MKNLLLLFAITSITLFVCCTPSKRTKEYELALQQAKQDSINAAIKMQIQSNFAAIDMEKQRIQDSISYNKKLEADPNLVISDFDWEYTSDRRNYYDKNEIHWTSNEKNYFRFVYKKNLKKLIVYKNEIQFKIYKDPVFSSECKVIYCNDKIIFKDLSFAPKGFNKSTEYYDLYKDPLKGIVEYPGRLESTPLK